MILFQTVLFKRRCPETIADKNGRFLVTNVNINQDELFWVNIYTASDQTQQVDFFCNDSWTDSSQYIQQDLSRYLVT